MGDSSFDIVAFLERAVAIGASDIHLSVNEYPAIRKDGKIIKINMPILTETDIDEAYGALLPANVSSSRLDTIFDLDFAYEIVGCARFRVNLSKQLGRYSLVIRTIPYDIKTVADLNLPKAIEQFATLNNGLVLITGPTGSGKSTTIASLIDYINTNYPKHIITIEDPLRNHFHDFLQALNNNKLQNNLYPVQVHFVRNFLYHRNRYQIRIYKVFVSFCDFFNNIKCLC